MWPLRKEECSWAEERLLRLQVEVEDFLVKNQKQATDIVKEKLHYDDSYISDIWQNHSYSRIDEHSTVT